MSDLKKYTDNDPDETCPVLRQGVSRRRGSAIRGLVGSHGVRTQVLPRMLGLDSGLSSLPPMRQGREGAKR